MDGQQFASVVEARKANDHLSLKTNASVKKMMNKYDKTGTQEVPAYFSTDRFCESTREERVPRGNYVGRRRGGAVVGAVARRA